MRKSKKKIRRQKRTTRKKYDYIEPAQQPNQHIQIVKTELDNITTLASLANQISKASQPPPSATPLAPDQLVEAQLPRIANLSNKIQLDQIGQQYLQEQLKKYKKQGGGGTSSDVRSPTSTEVRSPTSTSTEVRSPTSTSTEVRSPTSTSTEVRSPTSTSTEVRSPTSTSTEVRSPTSTSTDAYTQGNVTVTGGAGAGATTVYIGCAPEQLMARADKASNEERSKGSATRIEKMIKETSASRVPGVMPDLMTSTSSPRVPGVMPDLMKSTSSSRPKMLIKDLMKATSSARPKIPIKEMMNSTSASRPKIPIKEMMNSVSNKNVQKLKTKKYKRKVIQKQTKKQPNKKRR